MKINVSFDWFRFSTSQIKYNDFYFSNNLKEILKLGENDLILKDTIQILNHNSIPFTCYEINTGKCARGYRYGLAINEGISVSLCGPELSTLFELTGKGCYNYAKSSDYIKCWYDLFNFGIKNNFKFSRLDIAYDLIGLEDVDDFIKWLLGKIKSGSCRTRWKENYDSETISPNDGYTMYLGSPSSSSRIRIYNKNAEKISKDKNAFIEDDNFWRIEIQLTNSKNNETEILNFIKNYIYFFKHYVENNEINKDISDFRLFLTDYLNRFLEVRIKDEEDERISRCLIDPRWKEFIGSLEKSITFEQGDKKRRSTIEIKKDWIERSVFKALSQILICYGDKYFCKFLHNNLIAAFDDYKDIDKEQVVNFFKDSGIINNLITHDHINNFELTKYINDFRNKLLVMVEKDE